MDIDKLHSDIINISIDEEKMQWGTSFRDVKNIYKAGHRDARHASAELVLQHNCEEDPFDITVDDVITIKSVLTKLGTATPVSNELSKSQILSMLRQLVSVIELGNMVKDVCPECAKNHTAIIDNKEVTFINPCCKLCGPNESISIKTPKPEIKKYITVIVKPEWRGCFSHESSHEFTGYIWQEDDEHIYVKNDIGILNRYPRYMIDIQEPEKGKPYVQSFMENLEKTRKDFPYGIVELVNDNFWEVIDYETVNTKNKSCYSECGMRASYPTSCKQHNCSHIKYMCSNCNSTNGFFMSKQKNPNLPFSSNNYSNYKAVWKCNDCDKEN